MFRAMSMMIRIMMMLMMLHMMVLFMMLMIMAVIGMMMMMIVVMFAVMMTMMHNIFITDSLMSKFAHRRDKSFFQNVATRDRRTQRSKSRQSLRRGVIYSAASARQPMFFYDKPAE